MVVGRQTAMKSVRIILEKHLFLTKHHLWVDTEVSMLHLVQFTKAIPAGSNPAGTQLRADRIARDDP